MHDTACANTERGIGVGTVVEARAGAPYSDAIDVVVGDDTFALGRAAAASVWVSVDLT